MIRWTLVTRTQLSLTMMTSSMETFSALLAIWTWNSTVAGGIPSQRPVTQSFDVFFDLRLNHNHSALFDVVTTPLSCSFSYIYLGPSCLMNERAGRKSNRHIIHQYQVTVVWMNGLVYNREAGDLRRHHTDYDVTVMTTQQLHNSRTILIIVMTDSIQHKDKLR